MPRSLSRRTFNALALASAGTLGNGTASEAASGKIVIALSADIATLDPTIYHAIISFHARLSVFDALTDIGPDGSVVPRLATQGEKSADAKTWTFTIRPGARFHNGDPVTVEDVMYSYQKIMDDDKSPTRIYVNNIATL